MAWPPTAAELESKWEKELPEDLKKFLRHVMYDEDHQDDKDSTRLIYSVGADICRATTNVSFHLEV